MIEPIAALSVGLAIYRLAVEARSRSSSRLDVAWDVHERVEEFLRIENEELRAAQLTSLLPPLRDALTVCKRTAAKDWNLRAMLHLDFASCYAALGEVALREAHANDACDCVVRLLDAERNTTKREALVARRDAIYKLIDRRRLLIG